MMAISGLVYNQFSLRPPRSISTRSGISLLEVRCPILASLWGFRKLLEPFISNQLFKHILKVYAFVCVMTVDLIKYTEFYRFPLVFSGLSQGWFPILLRVASG